MGNIKNNPETIAVFSRGIKQIPFLNNFLLANKILFRPASGDASQIDAVVGWGTKATSNVARCFASEHHLPYLALEDGFFRSIGLGVDGDPPLSLVIDDCGIYYDANSPSRLETILNAPAGPDDLLKNGQLLKRSKECMKKVVESRLSKYNSAPDITSEIPESTGDRILVVDQTFGDSSIERGQMHEAGFQGMIDAAIEENPGCGIIVKVHPDVLANKKRGYLASSSFPENVRLFAEPVSPQSLFERVDRVYTVTSQMGFEALLAGKPVTCFGAPFYAGWGLTDDRVDIPRRTRRRTLEEIFAAACILYSAYIDPHSGKPSDLETVIDHLSLQRDYHRRNRGTHFCVGFSRWKRSSVRSFLKSPGNRIHFVKTARQAMRKGFDGNATMIVWGKRDRPELNRLAEKNKVPVWRMEDGFLRSIGLGSDLTAPASLVLDTRGMYYDPSAPSDLEHLYLETTFSKQILDRATRLRESIVAARVSKYNVGTRKTLNLAEASGRTVVLIPGQVEDDASITSGCADIRTNLDLVQAVRETRPEAYLIYKPHPDVVGGNRRGAYSMNQLQKYCDLIIDDISISDCLDAASEVHCMTSLVGFEALLRGLPVHLYGNPFYSSWGLTYDRADVPRRNRTLSLDMLVAGALILYPRYVNVQSGRFTSPEHVVSSLSENFPSGMRSIKMPRVARQLRKLTHYWKGFLDA